MQTEIYRHYGLETADNRTTYPSDHHADEHGRHAEHAGREATGYPTSGHERGYPADRDDLHARGGEEIRYGTAAAGAAGAGYGAGHSGETRPQHESIQDHRDVRPRDDRDAQQEPQERFDDRSYSDDRNQRGRGIRDSGATSPAGAEDAGQQPVTGRGESGNYRLRKYIVRETETIEVPVEREVVLLEPIGGEPGQPPADNVDPRDFARR